MFINSDRNNRVLGNLAWMYQPWPAGAARVICRFCRSIRASSTSAGASFAKNPDYFDPENIVKLAIEGGCNAVASTFGVLGIVARKYAHQIPFMVKINHNELLTYPNKSDQIMFGTIKQAADMGAAAVGATIYFGSPESGRQIVEVSQAFALAHEFGMATVLWCYLRNNAFKVKDAKALTDYHVSSDLTGQANHLGVTIQADIIKQKLPENNGGFKALNMGGSSYGKLDERMYTELNSDHPIDLYALSDRQQLHGPHRPDQQRRRVGQERPGRCGDDRRHQQARGRHGPHLRPQGVPETDEGRRGAAEYDSGCVSGCQRDDCVSGPPLWRTLASSQATSAPPTPFNWRGAFIKDSRFSWNDLL